MAALPAEGPPEGERVRAARRRASAERIRRRAARGVAQRTGVRPLDLRGARPPRARAPLPARRWRHAEPRRIPRVGRRPLRARQHVPLRPGGPARRAAARGAQALGRGERADRLPHARRRRGRLVGDPPRGALVGGRRSRPRRGALGRGPRRPRRDRPLRRRAALQRRRLGDRAAAQHLGARQRPRELQRARRQQADQARRRVGHPRQRRAGEALRPCRGRRPPAHRCELAAAGRRQRLRRPTSCTSRRCTRRRMRSSTA